MSARVVRHGLMPSSLLLGLVWALCRPFLVLLARAPLSVSALVLVVVGYFYAGANALYWQGDAAPRLPVIETQTPRIVPPARDPIAETIGSLPVTGAVPAPSYAPIDPQSTQSVSSQSPQVAIPGTVVGNPETFRVQSMLKALGFFSEEVDGYYGPRTADAIRVFETRSGVAPAGAITPALVQMLEQAYVRGSVRQQLSMTPPMPVAVDPLESIALSAAAGVDPQRELVAAVQRGLASLGFLHGEIDGIAGEATSRAIRNFEVFHNYRVTGEVSPELLDLLQAANATF